MRILHVVQELRPGGAERVVLALVAGARDAGHDVAVAAAGGAFTAELDVPLFDLPVIARRLSRIPHAAVRLRAALAAFAPNLVHVHNPGMAAVATIATRRGKSVPGIVTVHGVPDDDYRAAARVLRLSGLPVVACGPGVAAALAAAEAEVRTTIVNGVSPAPAPADRRELVRELGVEVSAPLAMVVGRLVDQKHQALALRAVVEIPELSLAIVGDGPREQYLRELASDLGVAERVVFTGARLDARAMIGAADVAVLPSRWEGLPLVALEALAAGTPLVATDVNGLRELLTNETDALLVPTEDPSALAKAIRRVVSDKPLRERLRENGLRTVAGYSDDAMVSAYLALYEETLGS